MDIDVEMFTCADDTRFLFSYSSWDTVYYMATKVLNGGVNCLNNRNISLNVEK